MPTEDPAQPIASTAAVNPYAPPQADVAPAVAGTEDAERIRRELLNHEASIRAVGALYVFGGAMMTFAAVALGIALIASFADPEVVVAQEGVYLALILLYVILGPISIYLGRGLRRLDPKVRTGVTILSVLGLLSIPVGTLINGYILYLLHGQKGKRVLTPEYQAIVAQTPHIKYRTSLWLILLVVVLILGFIGLIFWAVMSA